MMDRMVSGSGKKLSKTGKEKRALRTTINLTQPHILAIQEIEKRPFLNELWQDLNVGERSEVSSLCLDAKYQPARGGIWQSFLKFPSNRFVS